MTRDSTDRFDVPEVMSAEESPDLEDALQASEKSDGPGTWDDSEWVKDVKDYFKK